jgi:sulfite reductase alpha subunit-like flavoprotein
MSESPTQGPPKRTALVLYGSETGNAQEVAEELGALAERLHFVTHVAELNSVKAVRCVHLVSCFWCTVPCLQACAGVAQVVYVYDICCGDDWPG